tara:strand:+ start:12680 stop:13468 length:789 start_codon:yes stop_codon:yes gene_type:complete
MNAVNLNIETLNPALQTSKEMSKYYQTMDTRQLVEEMLEIGLFELVSVSTKKARKDSQSGRGKHIVKLRTFDTVEIGGELLKPEIVIMNSYDGTSPLKVYVGIYRIICENGLVIATKEFGQFSVRHMGTPAEVAFKVAMGFLDNLQIAVEKQKEMAAITLSPTQIQNFTRQALALRWSNIEATADISEVAEVLRPEDAGNNLWVVFNRVQEACTIGGFKVEGMKRKGRPLKSAVADTIFNQELFELALSYASIQDAEFEVLN